MTGSFIFKQKTADEMRISDWSSDGALPISSPACGRRWRAATDEGGERSELLLLFFLPDNRNAKIKSFRAVTARVTFLCVCKETWRKETHPAFAPGALHRVRGAGGIFRGASCPRGKRRTSLCGALRVLSAASAATEGPRLARSKATAKRSTPCRSGGSRELLLLIL